MGVRTAEVILPLRPISKPRPRSFMGQSRPYNDPVYKKWIKNARAHMTEFWTREPLEFVNNLHISFRGPARGDLDNRAGSVLDAGNGLIWKDDNVKVIGNMTLQWHHTKEKEAHIILHITWEEGE